jgi:chromosome segregation protein
MLYRLKSLELQGYKTFASRTVFDYTGAITAIVGPNGSGKSNIADSIRWVLGEQSYSLLRGKKTEDMIFSGSDQRPRASMASATMVFDNSDGWLPIEFSEVAITRRAYRDGQNEYLINGQRVRLKDVSELLAQSGLAERTYTIIGQGLVDAALSLKAEERRRLFEEAAGISLYRSRREEALRRLEVTHRNIERVQDILAELQPRLKSLEKQARRAREYEQLKSDLRALLLEWYGYHWHKAQNELADLGEVVHKHEKILNQAREEQMVAEEKIETERLRAQQSRFELNAYHRELSDLHLKRESLSKEMAVIEERIRSNQKQQAAVQAEMLRIQDELSLHKEIISVINEELDTLDQELNEAKLQVIKTEEILHSQQEQRAEIERSLELDRQRLNSFLVRKGELVVLQTDRKWLFKRLTKSLAEKNQILEETKKVARLARADLKSLVNELSDAQSVLNKFNQELSTIQLQISEVKATQAELNEQRTYKASQIIGWTTQHDILEQADLAMEGYSSGAKVISIAEQEHKISGVQGYIGRLIHVPTEYEQAITAVLGEFINAVVIETHQSMDEALDLLLEKASRGVLIPAWLSQYSRNAQEVGVKDGVIGRASDLVTCSDEVKPIIDTLLNNVFIVENRKVARKLISKLIGDARLVTLKGEVFFPSGTIVSGLEGKGTVISRVRQRKELRDKIREGENQISKIEQQLEHEGKKSEKLIIEETRLKKVVEEAEDAAERIAISHSQCKENVDQIASRIKYLDEQNISLNDELEAAKREIDHIETDLERLNGEISVVESEVKEKNKLIGGIDLDSYQSEFIHWNSILNVAERAHHDTSQRLTEHKESLQRAESILTTSRTHLSQLEKEYQDLKENENTLIKDDSDLVLKVGEVEQKIALTEKALSDLEKQIDEMQMNANQAKKRFSILESQYSQDRINLARNQERFDSLSRRVEDDFGLVEFDYSELISGPTPLPLEGMVQKLPQVFKIPPELEENIQRQRAQLRRMGAINPEAQTEYQEVNTRYNFMLEQINDLEKAETDVRQVIAELDLNMQQEFQKTFDAVSEEYESIFSRLFTGGSAHLVMTDPDDLTTTGIDIEARLPGKRTQGLSLLSGGERSLTATALIFALLKVSPTPFCVLDEVDAMLDEVNVSRFRELLHELSKNTQFIVVTHNRGTVQVADVIYGVTMGRDSTSQVISIRLDEVDKVI